MGVLVNVSCNFYPTGQTCFSCRAFFRRTSEIVKTTILSCENSGKCHITEVDRSCKSCRYQKCLSIGMNPSMIGRRARTAVARQESQCEGKGIFYRFYL